MGWNGMLETMTTTGMNVTAVEVKVEVSGSTHSLTAKAHWIDRPNQFDCLCRARLFLALYGLALNPQLWLPHSGSRRRASPLEVRGD